MPRRIRSRALRLIRNFLNSNAFKLPQLSPSRLEHSITRVSSVGDRIHRYSAYGYAFVDRNRRWLDFVTGRIRFIAATLKLLRQFDE